MVCVETRHQGAKGRAAAVLGQISQFVRVRWGIIHSAALLELSFRAAANGAETASSIPSACSEVVVVDGGSLFEEQPASQPAPSACGLEAGCSPLTLDPNLLISWFADLLKPH
jgi:hypothetical protein